MSENLLMLCAADALQVYSVPKYDLCMFLQLQEAPGGHEEGHANSLRRWINCLGSGLNRSTSRHCESAVYEQRHFRVIMHVSYN